MSSTRVAWSAGALAAGILTASSARAVQTVVSLTFDDTLSEQYALKGMLADAGMSATFYVNSGRLDQPGGFMTKDQVLDLQSSGNEIAGHTISHVDLPAQASTDEQKRQVCNDRVTLLADGFNVASFAYPFADWTTDTEKIVRDCGYNSARGVGGIVSPGTCNGCRFAESIPPKDVTHVVTPDSIKDGTSLADMKTYVTQAENNGGGWVVLVMHHVCDNDCNPNSVTPSQLSDFLTWLQARSPATTVETVGQVIGGTLQPGVSGPPVDVRSLTGNRLVNPSLETDANSDGVPDCWQTGGTGINTCTFSMVSPGEDGNNAEQIRCTAFDGGARRLYSLQDTGTCAPAVTSGHVYAVSAWYKSDVSSIFTAYAQSSSGAWAWFAQSPSLPTSSSYVQATWLTPNKLPAGTQRLSVAMTILGKGTLTFDNLSLSDNDTTPPTVSLTAPSDGATVGGSVTLTASAADDGGVSSVDFLINGTDIATTNGSPYSATWDSTTATTSVVAITAQATDTAGNTALSSSISVTVSNPPPVDTEAPTVSLTAPTANAYINGNVSVQATASDNWGVTTVDFLLDGALLGTASSAPYSLSWDTSTATEGTHSLTARASDAAGNLTTSAAVSVTVDRSAPTGVAITSPTDQSQVTGTVTLVGTAKDNIGVTKITFYDGATRLGSQATPHAWTWKFNPAKGTHNYKIKAEDAAGNSAYSAVIQVQVL